MTIELALAPKTAPQIAHAGKLFDALAATFRRASAHSEDRLLEIGRHEGAVPLVWAIASHPSKSEDVFTVVGVPRFRVDGTVQSVVLAGPCNDFAHLNLLYIVSEATGVPPEQIQRIARGALAYRWNRILQIDGYPGRGTLPLGMSSEFTVAFCGARALNLLRVEDNLGIWKRIRDRVYRRMVGRLAL